MTLHEEIAATSPSPTSNPADAPALSLRRVTKRYDNVIAVDDLELGPGSRRPANLEDVFVLLTGEHIG